MPLLWGAAYALLSEVGHALSVPGADLATFWPASGLFLAAVLAAAKRRGGTVAACAAANVVGEVLLHDRTAAAGLAFAVANTAEALAAAWCFRILSGGPDGRTRLGVVALFQFAAAAVVGATAGATLGTFSAVPLVGAAPSPLAWAHWWVGDTVGILTVAPLVLSWRAEGLRRPTVRAGAEAAAVAAGLVAAIGIGGSLVPALPGLWFVLAFPLLLWAGFRFGLRGASAAWCCAFLAGVRMSLGATGFAVPGFDIETRVIALQLFGVFVGFSLCVVAAMADEWKAALLRLRSVAVALRDEVAARRRAEESLRRSEERFALAAEGSSDGIWDWDLLTDRIYFSPRYKELLGFADDGFPEDRASWEFQLHPDDRPQVLRAIREHLKTGRRYDAVFRLRTKSGEYRWVETRGSAVRDAEGRPVRMVGSTTDVTDRWRADEARLAGEALLHV